MGHQVIERPNAYCLSKNEIRYAFSVDTLIRANLFLEVKVLYRILTGSSKINWQNIQTTFDSNLFIWINGVNILTEFLSNSGSININGGDIITIQVPIYEAWVGGSPYAKLRVLKNNTEVFNQYTVYQDEPNWLTYQFTADSDCVYSVLAYTKDESELAHGADIAIAVENIFTELFRTKLKPNTDGKIYVSCDDYIDSILSYKIPTANINNASSQGCIFYITSREAWDGYVDEPYSTAEKDHVRTAIKAGIEKHRYARNNFFINYLDITKSFLTWQPSNRMIWKDQSVYLTALIKSGTINGHRIRVTWDDTAGVNHVKYIAMAGSGFIWHFKVTPDALELATGDLYRYKVAILKADELIVSDYCFYLSYDHLYKFFDLIYINSLGGVDAVRIIGETAIGIERTYEDSEGGFSNNEWSALVKGHEASQTGITQRRTYKGDVGHMRTEREQEAAIELLLSSAIYQIKDSRLVPILALNKIHTLRKTTDKLISFPIEWTLSETNDVFTPADILLGLGNDTEIY